MVAKEILKRQASDLITLTDSIKVDNLSTLNHPFSVKAVTIAEFKRDLSSLLDEVARGKSIIVQKGRRRDNVAILSPYVRFRKTPRPLGLLASRGKPSFHNWEMDEHEFLSRG